MSKRYHPWLKAFSGLSINLSAAFLATPFIGLNIAFPNNVGQFFILTLHIVFAIVFLLLSILCERKLDNDR